MAAEAKSSADLAQIVEDADTGGRKAVGLTGKLIFGVSVAWSLFQLWYASPLPFVVGFGVLNDTEARAIHLMFAVFLAFMVFPAFASSPRRHVPVADWLLALVGGFCAGYLFLFYRELAERPGNPTTMDLVAGGVGVLVMLEATRRAMGFGMLITTGLFLLYVFAGPYMPDALLHKGASVSRFVSHFWLTTEGVYGVALGVSVAFVFLFVMFGTMLDIAGASNFMLQVSLALLGHLRGGPAKVAVVSSAANSLVSGSSVSNVVSGGIFTIPLMKRTGYSGVKAGAIEAASSINGQITPPVMGAAAFLMVEYVGIPYSEIIKHAFLPALISYIALFYIVHLEALKYDIQPLKAEYRPWRIRILGWLMGFAGTILAIIAVYYVITGVRTLFGEWANWVLAIVVAGSYFSLLAWSSRYPDLPLDDPKAPTLHLPRTWPTVRAGMHFFIPIVVLLWALMVEEMSPGTSAFWGTVTAIAMVIIHPAATAFFRRTGSVAAGLRKGLADVWRGLELSARNMVGIAVACASAGLIVGAITLTGMGLMMTDFVETISAGNVFLMLCLTAVICLLIGAGVPTTANYILVATLMVPVIVELGARSGLVIPLIAVHLFVFYFGIMADVTPPVGLASYAAAAISGEDPNATGWQATWYSFRTALLPFVFVFNPQILMIGIGNVAQFVLVVVSAIIASLLFAAATMGWFRTRSRWWEGALLLVASFLFFRPDFVIDYFAPKYVDAPVSQLYATADKLDEDELLILRIAGENIEGRDITKTVALPMGPGKSGREKIRAGGVTLAELGGEMEVASVKFGSRARKLGIEQGYKVIGISLPNPRRPSDYWVFIPAGLLAAFVWMLQRMRLRSTAQPQAT
jgi:TRAP transporter 4TM/12TM fusion protein